MAMLVETPISDWNVVVMILFSLTIGIPIAVASLVKLYVSISNKLSKNN